jgi:tight adherence protein B
MRRLIPPVLLVALSALHFTAPPALALNENPQLTQLSASRFPARSFVLTLPEGRTLPPGTVHVSENGRAVAGVRATPAGAAGDKDLGVVLVIDTSTSMRGQAIQNALAAARAFVAKRNPQQQVAVVTFNKTATVALPLTADQAQIDEALSSPPALGDGTHIYDAVVTAGSLLQKAGINAGSIVVLSDGADTGSTVDGKSVAAAVQAASVRIFTVGLRSHAFDHTALETLASAGHGDYSEARSAADLGPIYAALGSRLSHEYVLRYRSLAHLGQTVHVEVTAPGLVATSDYLAPAVPATAGETNAKKNFWASSLVLVLVSLIGALLIGIAVAALLLLRPRNDSVAKRIREFAPAGREPEEDRRPATKGKMLVEAEQSLEQMKWWGRVKEELDIARVKTEPVQVLAMTAIGTVFLMWTFLGITGSALAAFAALGTPFVVWSVVRSKADKQRKLFADQLADNLQVIASAMRAGHSFVGALTVAVEDAPEPARSEFRRAVADEKLGVPLEDSLGVIVDRMKSRDLEQVVLVALLQRQTGGNTAEVIDRVSETIRYRADLRRTVRTLTTQGRMARWIVSALPPTLLAAVSVINPGYLNPLVATTTGHVLLALGAAMVIGGSLVIKRIVNIEV